MSLCLGLRFSPEFLLSLFQSVGIRFGLLLCLSLDRRESFGRFGLQPDPLLGFGLESLLQLRSGLGFMAGLLLRL